MTRIRYPTALFAALALGLWLGAPAFAKECPPLDPVPLKQLLMPPPPDDSQVSTAELHELQDLQALRTRQQEEHAGGDHQQSIQRFLGEIDIVVPDQPPARPAVALDFFKCIHDATEKAVDDAKLSFNRIRPYKYPNNGLHVLKEIGGDDKPAYPSGHAAYGMVVGLILAEMLPEQKDLIIKRIEDYGYSRLVSGAHFRSNVYAGQIAGAAIAASFFGSKDDKFWPQFYEAKKDLRAALRLAAADSPPLGCERRPEAPSEDFTQPPNLDTVTKKLLYYRCTAYDADISQVLDEALAWVKVRAPEVQAEGHSAAIVLDIDETSLSNWTRIYRDHFAYIADGDCAPNDDSKSCGDFAWQRSGRAPAIGPTLNLYKSARCIGVQQPCKPIDVFFVTGRRESWAPIDNKSPRQWTRDNLLAAGYTDVLDDHLFLRSDHDAGVADYKSGARAAIEKMFHVTIIANIGDQQSDLAGAHADRPFKLPNPFYYIPSR